MLSLFQGELRMVKKVRKTDNEWLKMLGAERYKILREAGTETPFSGEYCDTKRAGTYVCGGCGAPLFESSAKFDSGCGWPSFFAARDTEGVATRRDSSHGSLRTEILCAACNGHLGHVFKDGPEPTGLRYCVNSLSISLETDGDH
jgi:peptide-methionine (R)-S-oxide reductase